MIVFIFFAISLFFCFIDWVWPGLWWCLTLFCYYVVVKHFSINFFLLLVHSFFTCQGCCCHVLSTFFVVALLNCNFKGLFWGIQMKNCLLWLSYDFIIVELLSVFVRTCSDCSCFFWLLLLWLFFVKIFTLSENQNFFVLFLLRLLPPLPFLFVCSTDSANQF